MQVDVSREFGLWVERAKAKAAEGSPYHRRVLELTAIALTELRNLTECPSDDKPSLKRVRQAKRHQVWRTSHPFEEGIAVRLICWFPPHDPDSCVVTLFGGDKATMGDVFYDSVGHRADMAVEQWIREKGGIRTMTRVENESQQSNPSSQGAPDFISGDEVLEDLLGLPGMREAVDAGLHANAEMDRVYAETLGAVRRAGRLTQVQVARRLGVGQAAVSRIESRDDILLSTLSEYLDAAGATNSRIVVTLRGIEVELDLRDLRKHAAADPEARA